MRAVDTNLLVRLITRDDPGQTASAEAFVKAGAWVSILALAETIWVLETAYGFRPGELGTSVAMLLNHESLVVQDSDVVAAALQIFQLRPALEFSDCLILEIARKAGYLPLGTFDRRLGRVQGTQKV
ncbi:MAG TPA: type II toxin-antitoxin system VapC family toxin [Bryobacteraceae bacterium]|nr:type II toxin-antitoxin system VapC family toxin [Bryobacteraceae bacterium]